MAAEKAKLDQEQAAVTQQKQQLQAEQAEVVRAQLKAKSDIAKVQTQVPITDQTAASRPQAKAAEAQELAKAKTAAAAAKRQVDAEVC